MIGKTVEARAANKVCSTPLSVQIAAPEKEFSISSSTLFSTVESAARAWNTAANRKIISVSRDREKKPGSITISLVNDGRHFDLQKKMLEEQNLKREVKVLREQLRRSELHYKGIEKAYAEVKLQAGSLKKESKTLEARIKRFNQGGARTDEQLLRSDLIELNKSHAQLIVTLEQIEKARAQYNSRAEKLNSHIRANQNAIAEHNKRYRYYHNPHTKAAYIRDRHGTRIEVYIFTSRDDLLISVTHELGHALGFGHLPENQGIMSPMMTDELRAKPQLSSSDVALARSLCP